MQIKSVYSNKYLFVYRFYFLLPIFTFIKDQAHVLPPSLTVPDLLFLQCIAKWLQKAVSISIALPPSWIDMVLTELVDWHGPSHNTLGPYQSAAINRQRSDNKKEDGNPA